MTRSVFADGFLPTQSRITTEPVGINPVTFHLVERLQMHTVMIVNNFLFHHILIEFHCGKAFEDDKAPISLSPMELPSIVHNDYGVY